MPNLKAGTYLCITEAISKEQYTEIKSIIDDKAKCEQVKAWRDTIRNNEYKNYPEIRAIDTTDEVRFCLAALYYHLEGSNNNSFDAKIARKPLGLSKNECFAPSSWQHCGRCYRIL